MKNIKKETNQYKSLLLTFFLNISHFSLIPFIPIFLVKNAGLPSDHIQYTYILGGLSTLVIFPWVGKLSDKVGSLKVFTIFCFLSIIPLIFLPSLHFAPLWLIYLGSLSFFCLSSPRYVAAQTLISLSIRPENKASFMSFNSSFGSFSQGAGSYIAGLIVFQEKETEILRNYDLIGYFCVIFSLLCIVAANWIKPYYHIKKEN
jgi:predicted MFS family arabinose efflux permease